MLIAFLGSSRHQLRARDCFAFHVSPVLAVGAEELNPQRLDVAEPLAQLLLVKHSWSPLGLTVGQLLLQTLVGRMYVEKMKVRSDKLQSL
mmetsp:Transcript_24692/g.46845  ORF Transcript_24692/g.46845 Transcript_24692/m.46845 type:complete len:90 (-) Transcript_24692:148-417(-)